MDEIVTSRGDMQIEGFISLRGSPVKVRDLLVNIIYRPKPIIKGLPASLSVVDNRLPYLADCLPQTSIPSHWIRVTYINLWVNASFGLLSGIRYAPLKRPVRIDPDLRRIAEERCI